MRSKVALSVLDQAIISAFNFALNLYLIRLWSPEDFGVFAVVLAAALLAVMLQNALINTPLAVHMPVVASAEEKALLRRVFTASNAALTLLLLCGATGGLWLWLDASQADLAVAAGLYIASQFLREYHRALLAVDGDLKALLAVDVAYVLLSVLTLAVFWFGGYPALQSVPAVLLVLSGWGLVSVLVYLWPRAMPSLTSLLGEIRSVFGSQAHEIRWSLLGVITTDIQNRGYLFIAAAYFGPTTVAHLQAGRIFFGPLNLLTSAWARVARPQLARDFGNGDLPRFKTILGHAIAAFVVFNVVFLIGLYWFWPYLSGIVFGDKYQSMGYIVAGWGLANFVFQVRSCLSVGVQSLRRFRELTAGTIYGAVVSMLIVVSASVLEWSSWLIASVIVGECVAISVILAILKSYLKSGAANERS
ncbi:lipopolysaccharide biosynthesis protein [Macromonas nakdongensis]|uniref:lipopolysaccharide biosynthesis protein n=1 Tax=Macromonas nakdongensis TaxID=1843082 RepID=UPI000C31C451|nr:hypothetical protein [Macromonas nakdongensis]